MIKLVAIGDIMGKAGRRAIDKALPTIKANFKPDIIIANGENAAGGFGITKKIFRQLTETYGIDCITTGNHWHDKREIYDLIPATNNLVIPANMMNVEDIAHGFKILTTAGQHKYAVVNLIGSVFMHPDNRNPFHAAEEIFARIPPNIKIVIVDIHAEATSEKQGMGRFLTGKASLVYGTHCHVPTADERIFGQHTGFVTDVGMTGPYDSVIGIRTEAALARMTQGIRKKFEPASGELWLPFIVASIDETTGACVNLDRHRWELDKLPDLKTV